MAIANITNNILTDSGVATSALQIALNGTGFVKISGTTISYDNSTYALDSAVVKLTGTQTVGGAKTFSTYSKFDGGVILKNNVSASLAGYVGLSAYSASGNKGINIDFDTYSASFYFSGILPYQYTFPAATGTIALTTDLSGYVTLATTQTITGAKTFTSTITATQINLGGGAGQNQLQSAANNDFILSNSGNFRIINNLNTVALLTITNAGAATFSSATMNVGTSTSRGNVTIEQTTTNSGLVINSAIVESPKLYLRDGGGTGYSEIQANNNLYLNASKVLIGTTDDGGKVVSYTTNAATQFKAAGTAPAITFSNTVLSPTIGGVLGVCTAASQFFTGTASSDMVLANQFSAGDLIFGTNNLARMRVKASGVINITSIPTSSAGLVSGDIYSSAGVLMIV